MRRILFICAIALVSLFSFYGCDNENMIQNEEENKPVSGDVTYEYVDLGLSVNWAAFNVGATKPEEFGDYYAWGETETKSDYSWETYKWCKGSENTLTKYCSNSEYGYNGYTDYKYVLDPEDDVAHVKWGGSWRMPTREEMEELMNNCSWTRDCIDSIEGFKVIGPSGNSIFLPAAGYYSGTEWIKSESFEDNRDGDLWSSTPGDDYKSYFVYFLTGRTYKGVTQYARYRGWSVRPVYPKKTQNDPVPGNNDSIPGNNDPIPSNNITSVTLDTTSLSLKVGGKYTLWATVWSGNEKVDTATITWKSDNESVATVSTDGLVKAISVGTATVTASNSGISATCSITVIPVVPEYVNLGLSVKWATFNVGATMPEEYGDYYAWGEIETKSKENYDWSSYKWCKGSFSTLTKYCSDSNNGDAGFTDNKTVLDIEDDVAHVKWGGSWRMPTDSEWSELKNNCNWTWETVGEVSGYRVTSKVSGYNNCSIFLPAAGFCCDGDLQAIDIIGRYWANSLSISYFSKDSKTAKMIDFTSDGVHSGGIVRVHGLSIRPVCP